MSIRNAFVKSAANAVVSDRPIRSNTPARPARDLTPEERKARRVRKDEERAAKEAEREAQEQALAELIDRSAHYLVMYDGHILATFTREDDAMLFEAELADLDRAHDVQGATCEVLDRRGRRIGGYMITAGSMYAYVRDEDFQRKYSNKRARGAA